MPAPSTACIPILARAPTRTRPVRTGWALMGRSTSANVGAESSIAAHAVVEPGAVVPAGAVLGSYAVVGASSA